VKFAYSNRGENELDTRPPTAAADFWINQGWSCLLAAVGSGGLLVAKGAAGPQVHPRCSRTGRIAILESARPAS
jgi:hypothetical protein